jgi:hypothetical protein
VSDLGRATMDKPMDAMTARPGILSRRLLAAAAAAVVVALAALPAAADPPPAGIGTTSHGFLVKRGVFTTIDHPDAAAIPRTPDGQTGTGTTGINDHGQIVGVYESRDRVVRHFVRDQRGRFTIIADPPGTRSDDLSYETTDINNRGQIVGFYNDDRGFTTTGFLRTKRGRFVDINVPGSQLTGPFKVNDRRQVVGIYVDAAGALHGFRWEDGEYETIDVPGATATAVLGVNNRGQMVGSYIDAAGAYHGFLRHRGGDVTTLPEAPGAAPTAGGTQPVGVNDQGQIIGLAYDSEGGSRGFLYERGRFRMIAGPAATFTRGLDINNRRQIVGDYGTKPPLTARSSRAGRVDLGGGLRSDAGGGGRWLP